LAGCCNHLGRLSYYRVNIKFRNESEPLPNSTSGAPSSLKPVFSYDIFLEDNATWKQEFSFSFVGVSFGEKTCLLSRVVAEGYSADVKQDSTVE